MIDDGGTLEDVCSLLADAPLPPGFYSCNTEVMPGIYNWTSAVQMFTSVRVFRLSGGNLTNRGVSKTFNDLCEDLLKSLYFKLRSMVPCCLCHLNFCVAAPEDELVQVTVTAVAMTFKDGAREPIPKDERFRACPVADRQTDEPEPSTAPDSPTAFTSRRGLPGGVEPHDAPRASCVDYGSFTDRRGSLMELIKVKAQTLRGGSIKTTDGEVGHRSGRVGAWLSYERRRSALSTVLQQEPVLSNKLRTVAFRGSVRRERCTHLPCLLSASPPEGAGPLLRAPSPSAPSCSGNGPAAVKMTPLSFLPGTTRGRHLGVINMFFVRETSSLREEGGASGFLHSFVAEVFAVVRAHVAALGGDAVLSFRVKECVLRENPNKNQAQCVIGVGGDAVASAGQVEPECQRR
ncbi:C2 domain-containing protein 5-like [Arapaima gigas]